MIVVCDGETKCHGVVTGSFLVGTFVLPMKRPLLHFFIKTAQTIGSVGQVVLRTSPRCNIRVPKIQQVQERCLSVTSHMAQCKHTGAGLVAQRLSLTSTCWSYRYISQATCKQP